MRVRAFAKINLSLHVAGTRPDGYHELRTVFQSIALHDTLVVSRTRQPFALACDDPACPADRTNLVWRAAERLWAATGRRGVPRGAAVRLIKRIPIHAGLGGGSSDAAAAIRALGALWRVRAASRRAIARALGADVPFFLEGGTALGLGRGDRLVPLEDAPSAWVVLAVPSFGVATADAYAWFDRTNAGRLRVGGVREARGDAAGNDLERVVSARHPQIAHLVAALRRRGAVQAAMTGSGSAVFGLFAARPPAARAAAALAGRRVSTILTRTLDRRAYRRLAGL
jgi:4-diphosphocytidyl-2-C-methyl-D-erythritol kinase